MPLQVQVTGKVDIRVEFVPGTIETLGISEDMVEIEERAFWHNVPGDANGGPQGPPIEVQWLGATHLIRCVMSTWDETHLDTLRQRQVNTAFGVMAASEVGTLMLNQNALRIILDSPTRPLNYPTCIVREAIAFPMGTKYSAATVIFEAHRDPAQGLLHNTDITPT